MKGLVWMLFIMALPGIQGCGCPTSCTCSSTKATCTAILTMPTCFPTGITDLTVKLSPNLSDLNKNDIPEELRSTLVGLHFFGVGFRTVDEEAFHDMPKLKTLEITGNSYLDKLKFDSDTAPSYLEYLNMAGSFEFDTVSGLKYLPNLKKINFTACEFRKIYDDTFEGLNHLEELYINVNPIYYIQSKAFNDMTSLRVFQMRDNNLDSLYPEYFETAWEAETLKEVDVRATWYRCRKMCSLTNWMNDNEGFKSIAQLGMCARYSTLYVIENIDEKLAGCGLGGWAIFGICIGCIVALGLIGAGVLAFLEKRKQKKMRNTAAETGTAMLPTTSQPESSYPANPAEPVGYGADESRTASMEAKAAEANQPPPSYKSGNNSD